MSRHIRHSIDRAWHNRQDAALVVYRGQPVRYPEATLEWWVDEAIQEWSADHSAARRAEVRRVVQLLRGARREAADIRWAALERLSARVAVAAE